MKVNYAKDTFYLAFCQMARMRPKLVRKEKMKNKKTGEWPVRLEYAGGRLTVVNRVQGVNFDIFSHMRC